MSIGDPNKRGKLGVKAPTFASLKLASVKSKQIDSCSN